MSSSAGIREIVLKDGAYKINTTRENERLMGGVRFNRAIAYRDLSDRIEFNLSGAPAKVQLVLINARDVLVQNESINGCEFMYTSGSGIGINPSWNVRLYVGNKLVWRDSGKASLWFFSTSTVTACMNLTLSLASRGLVTRFF